MNNADSPLAEALLSDMPQQINCQANMPRAVPEPASL
jgi:hypothetical protein